MPLLTSFQSYVKRLGDALSVVNQKSLSELTSALESRLDGSSSVFILGNGGSAANAHHITGDYIKTFALKHQRLRIECLSDNNCYLTAASNDLDFSEIYEVLIGTRIRPNDLLIFLSGSGNSINLVKAARAASRSDILISSITGYDGGALKDLSTISVHVPVYDMEVAEDIQLILMHHVKQELCQAIDSRNTPCKDLYMAKYYKRISEGLVS